MLNVSLWFGSCIDLPILFVFLSAQDSSEFDQDSNPTHTKKKKQKKMGQASKDCHTIRSIKTFVMNE